jgi:hypothetical protein
MGFFRFEDHIEGLPYWSDWLVGDVKQNPGKDLLYTGTYGWMAEMSGYTDPKHQILDKASPVGEGFALLFRCQAMAGTSWARVRA